MRNLKDIVYMYIVIMYEKILPFEFFFLVLVFG